MPQIKVSEIRAKFPMYADLSDDQLISGIRQKFYSDIPIAKFSAMIDRDTERAALQSEVTGEMSGLRKFAAGYGGAVPAIARGVGQLFGSVPQSEVDEAKRLEAPLMKTGAGVAGNIAGNVAAALPTAFIPGAATLPGAAAVGAGLGFIQPVASDESRLTNTALGGAAGAGGVAIGRGIKAGYQGAKALAEPFTEAGRQSIAGRTLQRFGVQPGDVAGLSNAPTVTGARTTLAEQIQRPEGAAAAARLQDSLRSVDPQIGAQMAARETENNAARVGTLQTLAGEGGARDAAEKLRQTVAKQLYDEAFQAKGALTPSQLKAQVDLLKSNKIEELMKSPAIQEAMKQARTNASNAGKTMADDGSIEGLHNMKLAIDDMIKSPETAAQAAKIRGLDAARNRLVKVIETLSPSYKDARTAYAELSKPINQNDVAAQVLKKGASATEDLAGNRRLMPDALARTMADEGKLIKDATGRDLGGSLKDLLEPDQLTKLSAVAKEVDKLGAVGRAANGPGSATAQRLASQNVLRQLLGPTGLPQSWSESTMLNTLMRPVQFAYNGIAEPKIQSTLADLVMNPELAQKAMAAATPAQRKTLAKVLENPLVQQAVRTSLPAATVDR